ncbi:hypothetical protein PHMEG_0004721 [Phytophthora megakarya]|uniref:Uncharacterized protein n=1 Tax=Phytophthora megakarya TaxID=4795 RepID=A0A225WV73_9STRA|nr:hypothetical protein PHMEG_0004721 [Phytophthora megakarya]
MGEDKLKAELSALVYATNQLRYDDGKWYLLKLLDDNVNHELYLFFMKNWDASKEEWVIFERGNVPHLGNQARIQVGEIKQVVNRSDSIDELISTRLLKMSICGGITESEHAFITMKTQNYVRLR